jgi:hypothetical protein
MRHFSRAMLDLSGTRDPESSLSVPSLLLGAPVRKNHGHPMSKRWLRIALIKAGDGGRLGT